MKSLKSILVLLFTAFLLFGFVSCSDDDDDDSFGSGRTVTLDFDISSFSDSTYYAVDPELENVKWYLRLKDSSWTFGARYKSGYHDSDTPENYLFDFAHFCKGTFTVDGAKITLTKTHYGAAFQNTNISVGFTDEELLENAEWTAYSSEVSNWKSGTLSDSKLSLQFTTSELDYKTTTEQQFISIPQLTRN